MNSLDPLLALVKRLTTSPESNISTSLLSHEDITLLARSLLPSSERSARSTAILCLSKLCEGSTYDDVKSQQITTTFTPYMLESVSKDNDEVESLIPLTSLLAGLYPHSPKATTSLLNTKITSEGVEGDVLGYLLEAAELPSGLQVPFAEMLAQGAGSKEGREMVSSRGTSWLEGAMRVDGQGELGGLCAVALSKLGNGGDAPGQEEVGTAYEADPEALARTMISHLATLNSESPTLLPTLEGLSILSLQPRIKDLLSTHSTFLRTLISLSPISKVRGGSLPQTPRGSMDMADPALVAPVETGLCYGITTILINLTTRKAVLSCEDQQIAKLRAMAISGKKGELADKDDDGLDGDDHVKDRVARVIRSGGVGALSGLVRAESELVRRDLGRLCLNLVEEKENRPVFIRDGGFKALSTLLRVQSEPPKTSKEAKEPNIHACQALAKLVITTPPHLLFPPPHITTSLNALTPLYHLLANPGVSALQTFEALMALTNIASISPEIASRIVKASVILPQRDRMFRGEEYKNEIAIMTRVEELMLDENNLVRRAATELVCNLSGSPAGFVYFGEGEEGNKERVKSRLNVLLVLANIDDLPTRLAAGGALAILTESRVCRENTLAVKAGEGGRTTWKRVMGILEEEEVEEDGEKIRVISTKGLDAGVVLRGAIILLNLLEYVKSIDGAEKTRHCKEIREAGVRQRFGELMASGLGEEIQGPLEECARLLSHLL